MLNNLLSFYLKIENFSQNTFFTFSEYTEIPNHLEFRNKNTIWIAMIGLACSFILIAISKVGTTRIFHVFSKIIFKNNTIVKIVQDEYSLKNFSSFILVVNFILTSSILSYLSALYFHFYLDEKILYLIPLIPLYIYFWPLFGFNLISFLTNEKKVVYENKLNSVALTHVTGFIFSFILLIWAFNLKWSFYFVILFIFLLLFLWIFKLIRGILFSFQHGISWYYIFLYLCTLEILPIVLLYKVYSGK